jgi:hypothetical protein
MLKKHAKMFNIGIDKHSTIPHTLFVIQSDCGNPGIISSLTFHGISATTQA